MDIKQFQKEIHENAVNHGWYDESRTPAELLCLVHSEVSEALEEVRKGKSMNQTYYSGKTESEDEEGIITTTIKYSDIKTAQHHKPEGVPAELADIIIRVLDIAGYYGIDMEAAVLEKHEYNKTRPYKHGGKKL